MGGKVRLLARLVKYGIGVFEHFVELDNRTTGR